MDIENYPEGLKDVVSRFRAWTTVRQREAVGRTNWNVWNPILEKFEVEVYRGPRKCFADEKIGPSIPSRISTGHAHTHRPIADYPATICIAKSAQTSILVHELAHHLVNTYGTDGGFYDGDLTGVARPEDYYGHGEQWRQTYLRMGGSPLSAAFYDPEYVRLQVVTGGRWVMFPDEMMIKYVELSKTLEGRQYA